MSISGCEQEDNIGNLYQATPGEKIAHCLSDSYNETSRSVNY
jgi:hypothetical protein